ncbi:MAG TPA: 60S ribosomal export protein NMD3 [Thermoplasmata archaeon]|nr:60S ribosomal export protein NMD3 [Thermoplasmata archaeon]
MSEGEFCVVCGATDRPLVEGVCAECAADRTKLVSAPQRAEVTVCPHCGARQVGAHWERPGSSQVLTAEDLSPFLEVPEEVGVRHVLWEETNATATVREFVGRALVRFRGIEREVDVPLSVRTVHQTCPDCSRKSGRYYTATIQLRGPAEGRAEKAIPLRARLEEEWVRLVREMRPDWRKAVGWREELPEGLDCFFTDTMAARSVAKLAKQHFGATVKESSSLVGRKNGQDLYRVTFCLRFPRRAPEAASRPLSAADERAVEP